MFWWYFSFANVGEFHYACSSCEKFSHLATYRDGFSGSAFKGYLRGAAGTRRGEVRPPAGLYCRSLCQNLRNMKSVKQKDKTSPNQLSFPWEVVQHFSIV